MSEEEKHLKRIDSGAIINTNTNDYQLILIEREKRRLIDGLQGQIDGLLKRIESLEKRRDE